MAKLNGHELPEEKCFTTCCGRECKEFFACKYSCKGCSHKNECKDIPAFKAELVKFD